MAGILLDTVSITEFNRGRAAQIFERVGAEGPKIVMKNNAPACVLLSPEDYNSLVERAEQSDKENSCHSPQGSVD